MWTVDDVIMPFPLGEEEASLPEAAYVVEEMIEKEVVLDGVLEEGVEVRRVL